MTEFLARLSEALSANAATIMFVWTDAPVLAALSLKGAGDASAPRKIPVRARRRLPLQEKVGARRSHEPR